MNEKDKERLIFLKELKKKEIADNSWKKNTYFVELINKISEVRLLSCEDGEKMLDRIESRISFSEAGHIIKDERIDYRNDVRYEELRKYLKEDDYYYIIWDNLELPIIRCSLASIINNSEKIEAVAFNFIIVSETLDVCLESVKFGNLSLYYVR